MTKTIKNIAASNRAKLLNLSRRTNQSFQELVQYFAMSRFLFRLAVSDMSNFFILKGAMLFHARNLTQARSTMDIDFLGKINNSKESIHQAVLYIINQKVDADGLCFLNDSIVVSKIINDSEYVGRRVSFKVTLTTIQIPMQLDIGFGDKTVPEPSTIDTPTLLNYPSAKLKGYAFETSIAEKIHSMIKKELLNSRIKDFYDIWFLFKEIKLKESCLINAIVNTLKQRDTIIDLNSVIFTDEFIHNTDKQKQWTAFCKKRNIKNAPKLFAEIIKEIFKSIIPILQKAKKKM